MDCASDWETRPRARSVATADEGDRSRALVIPDVASNRLDALSVATYLGQPNNPVNLNVRLGALDDGTTYPADIQLAAQSANVAVAVQNSGYRKLN